MSELGDRISEELDELRRIRDELRVRVHLGAAEAKELWEKSERKLGEVEATARRVSQGAEEELQDIGAAARLLLDEIRSGYRRIRELL